ncbi:hypothetical protein [Akkermansia sp.]|uniref:hypothetical protein n=1 Tax=Akkermansia sp. TaxID=1872421 RepID=UPI0025C15D1B|nr:hypothetical protein [Akkermansia sp.]MCC8149060.1 hypothetical protein [Akkermansia sp.]
MKCFVAIACWCAGILMAADMPVKSVPYSGTNLTGPVIGLSSMGLMMGEPFNFVQTHISLYCVFPGTEMLVPEQPAQELKAIDSNGVRLRVRSVRLREGAIKDKRLRRVDVNIDLKDVPSPGARWIRVSGTLFLPLCQGLESLDFGRVELKENGVSIPVPDPIAVRRAQESNRVEIADMSKLETVTLKVTRQEGSARHAPAKEPGVEWKFMVYAEMSSENMFRAEDFVFHDLKGTRLKPRVTCHYSYNEDQGKSFLFHPSPRFVEVAVLYQGPSRIKSIPVDIKIGVGGAMPEVLPPPQEVPQPDAGAR